MSATTEFFTIMATVVIFGALLSLLGVVVTLTWIARRTRPPSVEFHDPPSQVRVVPPPFDWNRHDGGEYLRQPVDQPNLDPGNESRLVSRTRSS